MTEEQIACHGKARFPNRRAAKRRANAIRRTGGPHLRAYRCPYCNGAHLGHRPGHATYLRNGQPLQETQT